MWLKTAGLALIFIVCSAAGVAAAARLSRRVSQLESILGAVSFIATEIRYFSSPVEDLLDKACRSNEFGRLKIFDICRTRMELTRDFEASWATAVQDARPYLCIDDGDAQVLTQFGGELGKTDVEGQLANCSRCEELLSVRLASAREDRACKGRMYRSLGVLAGVFLVILFI